MEKTIRNYDCQVRFYWPVYFAPTGLGFQELAHRCAPVVPGKNATTPWKTHSVRNSRIAIAVRNCGSNCEIKRTPKEKSEIKRTTDFDAKTTDFDTKATDPDAKIIDFDAKSMDFDAKTANVPVFVFMIYLMY